MSKAFSEPEDWRIVREVDKRAREIWRYGQESFSDAWMRAYELMYGHKT